MKPTIHAAKTPLRVLCCLLSLLMLIPLSSLSVGAKQTPPLLSVGLRVLAEQSPMAMAGLSGGEIAFETEDFARAMNLGAIRSVTVTKIPDMNDGTLRVGSVVVSEGQTVSAANLSLLTYVPAKGGVRSDSFRFTVNDSPVEMTCELYMLEEINRAPTLELVPKTALSVSTHKNITLWGELPSYDPDGDATRVEIVSYPTSGLLRLTDPVKGSYTYTPTTDRVGKDSFTYVVRDTYGNYSASATVSLQIVKPSTSVVYADLTGSSGYNAALSVTEAGLMSGIQSGGATYFRPELTVSRSEFLMLAMKAMGIEDAGTADRTVFADDNSLSPIERSYVSAAYQLGYIKGEEQNGSLCFFPHRAITRAEAAVLLGRMLNAATPTVKPLISDADEIPAFAEASVYSMASLGILNCEDGNIQPMEQVTRMDTAEMLNALMVYREK